jgi:hypothetical protein
VPGRVRLQQQARRAPGLLEPEVRQPDRGGGLQLLPVDERGVHLLVAGERVDVVRGHVHDRTRVAQPGLEREGIGEDLRGEGVDACGGDRGGGHDVS